MTAMLEKTADEITEETAEEIIGGSKNIQQAISKLVGGKSVIMTPEMAEDFGRELDALRERVVADLGERDATYIRRVIKAQRALEVGGRGLLFAGILPPAWIAGTAMLAASKILDNMEIGHNVMHGQYDWMGDPALTSRSFEWDSACPSDQWRHSHNYLHHTHTNIVGMDRDIGYGILRMSEDQRWKPYFLGNPVYAFLLMVLFQYGVALHELETERITSGQISIADKREILAGIWRKVKRQTAKDYVAFPLLAGPFAPWVFTGNMTANLIRNVWSYAIIFCGHFPDGTQEFSVEETENESRGMWYFRQILGSANLTGLSPRRSARPDSANLFHLMSGNLSFQIEHHLFPDIPAFRHAEISVEVQEICERYGIPYNKGPLPQQFATVVRKICRLALPWR
jgi:fatty acid desaturase